MSFFSNNLSSVEQDYTWIDREYSLYTPILVMLILFLERFIFYREGSTFEIYTDNEVLKHSFSKHKWSRWETRWLETLANFGIYLVTLKPAIIHVLWMPFQDPRNSWACKEMFWYSLMYLIFLRLMLRYSLANMRMISYLYRSWKQWIVSKQVTEIKSNSWKRHTSIRKIVLRPLHQGNYVFPGVPSHSFLNYLTIVGFLDTLDFLNPCQDWITIIGDKWEYIYCDILKCVWFVKRRSITVGRRFVIEFIWDSVQMMGVFGNRLHRKFSKDK